MPIPQTRYAKSGDVNIACSTLGDGSIDVILVVGWVTHLECMWEEPAHARFLEHGAFASNPNRTLDD